MQNEKVYTKGDVIVNELEVGDVIYEIEYGHAIRSVVQTKPSRDEDGYWTWKGLVEETGEIIDYGVNEQYPHYAPNLYGSVVLTI